MNTIEYKLPEYWASYLINGDGSGLEDREIIQIEGLLCGEGLLYACLGCSDEPEFMTYHDAQPYGVLACDCLTYTFPTA